MSGWGGGRGSNIAILFSYGPVQLPQIDEKYALRTTYMDDCLFPLAVHLEGGAAEYCNPSKYAPARQEYFEKSEDSQLGSSIHPRCVT